MNALSLIFVGAVTRARFGQKILCTWGRKMHGPVSGSPPHRITGKTEMLEYHEIQEKSYKNSEREGTETGMKVTDHLTLAVVKRWRLWGDNSAVKETVDRRFLRLRCLWDRESFYYHFNIVIRSLSLFLSFRVICAVERAFLFSNCPSAFPPAVYRHSRILLSLFRTVDSGNRERKFFSHS